MSRKFKIDVALNLQNTPETDGFYRAMRWGVAYSDDDGTTWTAAPTEGRRKGQYGYGRVLLDESTGISEGDTMTFGVYCSNPSGEASAGHLAKTLWIRYEFRPSMLLTPKPDLRTSPFDPTETRALLQGSDLESIPLQPDIKSVALGGHTFPTGIADVLAAVNTGPLELTVPGEDVSQYEFTAYLAVLEGGRGAGDNGTPRYYRTDPEIITGRRGGG